MGVTVIRGQQSDRFLKLTHDRKVSPRGIYQASRDRWVPTIPNSFGLPAGLSCPGKTPFCKSCYAVGSERSKGVAELVYHNGRLLTEAGTVDAMADLLGEMVDRYVAEAYRRELPAKERIFRIHWDGDFFSLDYAAAWARVIHDTPDVLFWAYTRSFVEPVNVVPILAGIDNLALYLSADQWNIAAAREVVRLIPGVHLAICAVDYRTAHELAGKRRAIVCPENAEKMPLMKDGRGACVDCRLCPDARADVIFSTSHREDVSAPRVRLNVRPVRPTQNSISSADSAPLLKSHSDSSVDAIPGLCLNCGAELPERRGPGRPRIYCSKECRWAWAYSNRARAS